MHNIITLSECLINHHAPSIISGCISAFFWVLSAKAKAKTAPGRFELTFENPQDNVDMHQYFLTVKMQAKYNAKAAFAAAAMATFQVLGW